MMIPHESWRFVGQRIRQLRKANRLTLRQLALDCDLSPNAISLVERGEVAPSVATLCKIACALGVSAGSLFQDICSPKVVLHRMGCSDQDVQVSQLMGALGYGLPQSDGSKMVGFSQPDSELSLRQAILCLCGKILFEVDEQTFCLEPGDSLTFNVGVFHRWHNPERSTGVAVLILPSEAERNNAGN